MRNHRSSAVARAVGVGLALLTLGLTGCGAFGTELGWPSGSATLSWTVPTRTANGSPLTDLAGYNVYYGRNPSALICRIKLPNPQLTRYRVGKLTGGRWYFVVTAYTRTGTQSVPSNVLTKSIPGPGPLPAARGLGRCEVCASC